MHKGKHIARRRKQIKPLALLLSLSFILLAAVGGTVAYLTAQSNNVTNTFTPSKVLCAVEETFDGTSKSNVTVKNTGDTEAFIRAMVIVTWKDADGNVCGAAPKPNTDYTITYGDGWTQRTEDGYWYCNTAIQPNASTPALIESCTPGETATPPAGYGLSVEIIADAVQSVPTKAAQEAWGATIVDGKLTPAPGN